MATYPWVSVPVIRLHEPRDKRPILILDGRPIRCRSCDMSLVRDVGPVRAGNDDAWTPTPARFSVAAVSASGEIVAGTYRAPTYELSRAGRLRIHATTRA